jgi:Beta-lactamase enzyme family
MYRSFLITSGVILLSIFMACTSPKKTTVPVVVAVPGPAQAAENKEDAFFRELFKNYPGLMDSVMLHRKDWNVQIIYTQVNRSRNGIPSLKHHYFNRENAAYFYPASTVKFPLAMLALEKLNDLKITGLNRNTTMITEAAYSGQTAVYNDPNTQDGRPTVAQYIKKILLVSDNDAYNRLYEFLGPEYINETLHKKGYAGAQILHRLNVFLSEDENRHTNPVNFYNANDSVIYRKPLLFNQQPYVERNDKMGTGYYSAGKLVEGPMDFSTKNKIGLEDLHRLLLSLVFPQAMGAAQRFNLTEEDRNFLLQYMSQFPSESVNPSYDSSYHDAYVKFIFYGSEKGNLPKNIRIFNKPGDAYGQLTDVAYVVDFEKNIEFFVSATIYCNSDGILNDDRYDYDSTGFPFMKNLGKILYDVELKRKRNFKPDLSSLTFTYDKYKKF